MVIDEVVPQALGGERIDRVTALLTGCSRAQATELIASGAVTVNGRRARKASERVAPGDALHIDAGTLGDGSAPQPDPSIPVEVIHADRAVIVVDKPAGQVVHPGSGTPAGTLVNGLLARYPELATVGDPERPGIVHRLDRGTSGLLMVARTEEARQHLGDQLAHRSVERVYLVVVWGHLDNDHGVIDAPLGRDPRRPTRRAVVAGGREARTAYAVVRRANHPAPVSVLECRLETGRTHQIRVHLAAIGHPVVGDETYGGRRQGIDLPRPALHAATLGFTHPRTGQRLRFESPPPEDLRRLLARLD